MITKKDEKIGILKKTDPMITEEKQDLKKSFKFIGRFSFMSLYPNSVLTQIEFIILHFSRKFKQLKIVTSSRYCFMSVS